MTLYKRCVLLTLEGLIGDVKNESQISCLDNQIALSKMKVFYEIKKIKMESSFDIFNYLKLLFIDKKMHSFLVSEIVYVLNFKKKFSQKNINRLISNYFKIGLLNIRKKTNSYLIPEQIINDPHYLNTISFSVLYSINQFYKNETKL
nr:hypothetical protein [Rhodomonas sp. NIES-1730]